MPVWHGGGGGEQAGECLLGFLRNEGQPNNLQIFKVSGKTCHALSGLHNPVL